MNKIVLTVAFAALLTGAAAAEAADGKMPPMHPDRPTHEMMEAKLADRLKLSKEQYQAMQDRRKADQVKIRDLMDQMKEIRIQMNEIRKSNMEAFESILTPEQKAEFEKIKEEGKARHMERKRMRHGMKPDPMSENRNMPPAVEKKPEAVDVSTPAEDPVKDADTVPTAGASSAPVPEEVLTGPENKNGFEDEENAEDRPPLNTWTKPISPDTTGKIHDREAGMIIEPEDEADESDVPIAPATPNEEQQTK